MTLKGRIAISMAAKGIKTPADLARKLRLNRQTVHKWMTGEAIKLEPENLFKLADALEVNPRWLATREGEPQPPRTVPIDDQRVLDLYKALPPAVRDSWVKSGDALLTATGEPSKSQPFKAGR